MSCLNTPFIQKRGILVHPEELTIKWLDWMQSARLNVLGLHPVGGRHAAETLEAAIDSHSIPESARLRLEAAKRGITVEYEAHAAGWLLPRSLFSRVPEWFRMDEHGERNQDFNFCCSNPDALSYVSERACLLASLLNTGADKYYFWLDDVSNTACHCPLCEKLSPSDQQLRIVNAMLLGLKKVNPNAKLSFIAYNDTLDVPQKTQPLDGVFLEYAPIGRNHHIAINDPDCEANIRETRALKELISFFGANDAKVLEYWMDNSMFSNWTKPPKQFKLDEEVMKRDVEYYASVGFTSITSFGCYLGPDYWALYGEPSLDAYGQILYGNA